MQSAATTVDQYIACLPAERRDAIARVRDVINANLPSGYVEGMLYGMIDWYVPLARYPDTYNGQPLGIVALASQKNYMALYLYAIYGDPQIEAWFRSAYTSTGKRLDMGKCCVRFAKLDALPLDVIAEVVRMVPVDALLARYEEVKSATGKRPNARDTRAAAKAKGANKPAKHKPAKAAKAKPAKTRPANRARKRQ